MASAAVLLLLCGCALFRKADQTTLRFHEQVSAALPESRLLSISVPQTGQTITVNPSPALSEKDVQSAELYETAGGAAVLLRFDGHGQFALDELTTRKRGQFLVVMLDGRPVASWLVNQRLTNGQFLLEGDFTDEEARQLVESLNRMSKKRR